MYLHLLLKLERTIVDVGVLISGRGIFKSVQGTEGKGRERDLYPPTCRILVLWCCGTYFIMDQNLWNSDVQVKNQLPRVIG